MEVIDAQVHIVPKGAAPIEVSGLTVRAHARSVEVTIEEMLDAMAAARVDAAIITAQSLRSIGNSHALRAAAEHPRTFAVVGTVDPSLAEIDDVMSRWRSQPGMLGVRVVLLTTTQINLWLAGGLDRLFAAAQRHSVPVCIYPPTLLREIVPTFERFAELQFVVDHLGLPQPTSVSDRDPEPFGRLPDLLALSRFANVAVKLTGAPTLRTKPYPFDDLWPHLHRIVEGFGVERIMWGSDWTRATG